MQAVAGQKPCLPTTDQGKALATQVQTLSTAVDSFESSVSGGVTSNTGAFAPTATFQQLLAADLLAAQLSQQAAAIAIVHTLDSGGTNLTRQSTMLGTRQYFSGGAVAWYALFADTGAMLCSGLAFGYHGFVAAGDIGGNGLLISDKAGVIDQNNRVGAVDNDGNKLPSPVYQKSSKCRSTSP
jgi:hypothetical protein